jgi:hypothetical protein
MSFGDLFGWLGGLIFVARLVPQPWRLYRHDVRAGVSWLGTANAMVSTTGWFVYGIGVGEPVLWVPSLAALVPEAAAVALLGWRPPSRRDALVCAGWAVLVLAAWPVGGRIALGSVIGVGIVAGVAPHVVTALRSTDLHGVARRTWQIALLDAALWGAYSVPARELMTGFYAVVLGAGATVILWRLHEAQCSHVPPLGPVGAHAYDV